METTFLVVSIADDGHEVQEHECVSYRDAEKESESYSCPIRIYAKVPIIEFDARKGFGHHG